MFENLPPLRDVIAAHDLRAKKALGQNFILDGNITDRIAQAAGDLTGKTVFEVGPGPGGLTRSLLKTNAKKIIAIEFDPRAIAALEDLRRAAEGRLDVVHGDALRMDLTALAEGPRVIVANLPYNIATVLLTNWLKQIRADKNAFESMVLMFQKEVGERIVAVPDNKIFGRLSIICQWLCHVHKMIDLPPEAFVPAPKVSSSVMRFVPKDLPPGSPEFSAVERITAVAFNQRRKMIRTTLKDYAGKFEALGIEPTKRAENLTVQNFLDLI